MTSFVCPTWSLVLWTYYLREDHDVFCMPYLVPGLMEILLERKSWRLLYALLGPGLMEILLERRPWRLLYALLGPWSYGNIT